MGEHHFNTEEAMQFGIEEAILLYNIRFWLQKNKANKKHEHDDYYWTYNSGVAFAKLFPYMTANKIQKILKKLELAGVIITGNYNKATYDRTKWYTLPEFAIQQKGGLHSAETLDTSSQSAEPIPDIKPDIKQAYIAAPSETATSPSPEEEIPPTPEFNSKEWILSLLQSPQIHINLIGSYFLKYAKHNFPTKAVANDALKVNVAPAVYLVKNFKQEDITKTLVHCQQEFSTVNWNLHTVKKQIAHVTAKA